MHVNENGRIGRWCGRLSNAVLSDPLDEADVRWNDMLEGLEIFRMAGQNGEENGIHTFEFTQPATPICALISRVLGVLEALRWSSSNSFICPGCRRALGIPQDQPMDENGRKGGWCRRSSNAVLGGPLDAADVR